MGELRMIVESLQIATVKGKETYEMSTWHVTEDNFAVTFKHKTRAVEVAYMFANIITIKRVGRHE